MNIVQLNATCKVGSTGKIMSDLNDVICGAGNNGFMVSGYYYECDNKNLYCASHNNPFWEIRKNLLISRITGTMGYRYINRTKKILQWIDEKDPDVIHLHNIHGDWIHIKSLFDYIKRKKVPVVWTLHDCWTFTGRCSYFELSGCDKWKFQCHDCANKKIYPVTYFFDKSQRMFFDKKEWFAGLENMTIVTPSEWLAGLVRQSFLKDYPVRVINNGIDLTVFKPTESDFRERFGLVDKKLVLGVAFGWGQRKGLDVFVELSKRLPENYRIILVGTDKHIDAILPKNIISIHRTQNQKNLAEIYTAADVFANPTREENYPTVNMESLACGTPVVTFKTGGSPEILDETCGSIVSRNDIDAMEIEIRRICEKRAFTKEVCLIRAMSFDKNKRFEEYVKLYENVLASETKNN